MEVKKRRGSAYERASISRLAAVQAYYQMIQQQQKASDVVSEFIHFRFPQDEYPITPNIDFFQSLMKSVDHRQADIQHIIESSLQKEWRYERIEDVLKSILYIATAELLEKITVAPAPVIISEYIYITRSFYAGKESLFINGYLDRLARKLGYTMAKPSKFLPDPETRI